MLPNGQLSFSDIEHTHKKKTTRRERFLAQLERLLPWSVLVALIEPHYPSSGRRGQQPLALESMLRVHIAQIAYNYSDPGMEDALYEIASLRQFCRFELDRIPDESAILRFRPLLEQQDLASRIFASVNQQLAAKNLFLKQGTIVDASLIAAPPSTKNRDGQRGCCASSLGTTRNTVTAASSSSRLPSAIRDLIARFLRSATPSTRPPGRLGHSDGRDAIHGTGATKTRYGLTHPRNMSSRQGI